MLRSIISDGLTMIPEPKNLCISAKSNVLKPNWLTSVSYLVNDNYKALLRVKEVDE